MRACLIVVTLLFTATELPAKPPELKYLHPAGAQRGTSVTVEAGGRFDNWPPKVWTDRPGITIEALEEKKQFKITAADQARPGTYWIRFYDDEGATTPRSFVVGTAPEVNEAEPNNDYRSPQKIGGKHVVINGRLNGRSDVDTFAVDLAAGQTLIASLTANEQIGSPMDGILEITNPDGFRLAYNHDTFNLDPQIVFTAPAEGTYLVRAFAFPAKPNQSISYSASTGYVYRLALTTAAFLDHAFPLAVSRQHPAEIELRGWNIPEPIRFLTVTAKSSEQDFVRLFHPLLANTGHVKVEPHDVTVESAVNDQANPQMVNLPVTVSGSIAQPREDDWFEFKATKGQKLDIRAESWSLGFPLDPLIRLTDAGGKRLAQADDISRERRDATIAYTIPADGTYRLMIRDLHRHGGFRYVYRLSIRLAQPDFRLKLAADTFTLAPGDKPLEVPVTVERLHGFDGEIDISLVGLPEGVAAKPLKSINGKPTAKSVKFTLTATSGPVSGPFQVVGTSGDTRHTAAAPISGFRETTEHPWLAVLPPKK